MEFKNVIKATIIQDSMCGGNRITTFELEYPRFIHAELMTHRVFSRNAASSRAIPIEKMLQHVLDNTAAPIHWGANQSGMQAKAELNAEGKTDAKDTWYASARSAVDYSARLADIGTHKQISNRITEPFQVMKTIVTATEYDNWFELRNHEDAQPEIHELAKQMFIAIDDSEPLDITPGEWHVPYIERRTDINGLYYFVDNVQITLEEAKMISASCCAQVSYRKSDDSLEKAKMVFDRLINSVPMHASPVEHQATPVEFANIGWTDQPWEEGITHVDRKGNFWSGNFKGWIQHRNLL